MDYVHSIFECRKNAKRKQQMRIPGLCNGKNSPTPPTRNYKIKKNTVSPFYKDLKKFLT